MEVQLRQVVGVPVCHRVPDIIGFVLIAVPGIGEEMIVTDTEVERTLEGVPMLPFPETVAHEDLFIQRRAHHHLRMSAHFGGREHFVDDDQRPRPLRFIIVRGVVHIEISPRLDHVRVDGERCNQFPDESEPSLRAVADRDAHALAVGIRLPLAHGRIVEPEASLMEKHRRRPVFFLALERVADTGIVPMVFVPGGIELHPFCARRVHIIRIAVPDDIRVTL